MPAAPPPRASALRIALGAVCACLLLAASAAFAQTTTFEARVVASLDDVEQFADQSMYVNSSDLELIHDSSDQIVGIRWTGLTIPKGATITAAWIQFAAKESWPDATSLNFYGQASDAAPQFTSNTNDVGARARTSAFVNWVPVVWNVDEVGANERTPDLKSVVQEIVNRAGWASGNPLAIIINGTGHRTAWAWDGNAALAPLLHIEYTTGAPPVDQPPVANLAVTQAASPPLTVSASAAGSTDTDATPIKSYSFTWGDGSQATVVNAPAQTATHTYGSAGTYTVTLVATDTGNLASTPVTKNITITGSSNANTVEKRVAASSDDAEENSSRRVTLNSPDLQLVQDATTQTVGMRWTGITIPQGSTITAAWIQFSSRIAASGATSLALRAQASDNATTFTTSSRSISNRSLTSASTTWSPAAWNASETGAGERTPDLSGVVQEVVNRSNWASGNALAIVVTGSGSRTAWAYDGDAAQAPLLHIEYSSTTPPPQDKPPTVNLTVNQAASPPLTVNASAAGSTDNDNTPIKSYSFDWGDGSQATVVNAPTQTAAHTYSSAGTYTVTLIATDTGGLTSGPATANINVTAASTGNVSVYVGYYDTHHPSNLRPKPSPWQGSSGVVFVGKDDDGKGNWDSSCLRIDNNTSSSMSVTVTCDIGSNHFALWGTNTIPAGGKLILAQTAFQNFDGSDTSPAGCYGCDPSLCLTKVVNTVPVIHVTVGGVTTNYSDTKQVLNTKGADGAGCPDTGGTRNDESTQWTQIFQSASMTAFGTSDSRVPWGVEVPRVALAPVTPNPVKGDVLLRFTVPSTSRVTIGLYDVAGRLVKSWLDREMGDGSYTQLVNVDGVTAGVYYCLVATPSGTAHRSVVVSR